MFNWLRKKVGIIDVEKNVVDLHKDMQKAFNRIDANANKSRIHKKSMRYDEIQRARKRRRKG